MPRVESRTPEIHGKRSFNLAGDISTPRKTQSQADKESRGMSQALINTGVKLLMGILQDVNHRCRMRDDVKTISKGGEQGGTHERTRPHITSA